MHQLTSHSAAPPPSYSRLGQVMSENTGRSKNMKIAVIGGTGLIGSQVVTILNASGHQAVPHSPSTGLDLLSTQGLPEALAGSDVVVNLTNSPTFDDASPTFFQTTMDNLLTAADTAHVGHAVILSIVGADQ